MSETAELQPDSLLLASRDLPDDDAALFLFYGQSLPKIDRDKPQFHCTGERLLRDRPEVYREVVRLLAEPRVSRRLIERICHVSHHTIESVESRESIPIATHKRKIAGQSGRVAGMLLDRIEELAPVMKPGEAAIAFGIVTEKHMLTTGDVTQRVEVGAPVDFAAKLAAFQDDVMKRVNGRVIEPAALTDSDGENISAKAAGAAGELVSEARLVKGESDSGTDERTRAQGDSATELTTEAVPDRANLAGGHSASGSGSEQGGEGVGAQDPPPRNSEG